MGFIHGLISAADRSPNSRVQATSRTAEWLQYAPPRVRSHRASQDRLRQLESENKRWRERALQAEARLKSIENSIQRIARQVDSSRLSNQPFDVPLVPEANSLPSHIEPAGDQGSPPAPNEKMAIITI
jgi:predicted  nucleic acid-binding Zn-ribbon protein